METIKSEGEILQVIDDLYDEGKREGALQVLSELKCDANIRSNCIISSFGVLTILQMEILRTYRYLNNDEMTEREEKRVCNALTIMRSLAVKQDIVIQLLDSYIVHFMIPLIETNNPRFVNIRKLCLTVVLEISIHDNSQIRLYLLDKSIFSSCLDVFKDAEDAERMLILMIINYIVYDIQSVSMILKSKYLQQSICECMVLAECQQDRMDDKLKQEFDDLLKKIKWPIRDKLRAVYDEIEKRVRENPSNK